MAVNATPGFDLIPSAERVTLQTNYITNFDFLNQYLPDTYEKEFERYGNRSISSFLRMRCFRLRANGRGCGTTALNRRVWLQRLYCT